MKDNAEGQPLASNAAEPDGDAYCPGQDVCAVFHWSPILKDVFAKEMFVSYRLEWELPVISAGQASLMAKSSKILLLFEHSLGPERIEITWNLPRGRPIDASSPLLSSSLKLSVIVMKVFRNIWNKIN